MEAIPRLPMLCFELKNSPEAASFGKLKRYIAECYHEDPETYSKEIFELEKLRSSAMRPILDVSGCSTLKRYYAQLHSLQGRFPAISEKQLLNFVWTDVHTNMISKSSDIQFEMSSILYNIGALHTNVGALDARTTGDGMKVACTHFQCSAWAFQHLREDYSQHLSGDMSRELLVFMEQLSFAQAQECILEKSLADNRKAGIVAKVTAQIIMYYNSALASLMLDGNEGRFAEMVENKIFKKWKRYVRFKISYLSAILLLYQGQQAEEQQKMGERVTLYQAACDKLDEAKKESKGMINIEQVNEALTFLTDVIEGKRKNAKSENEFIYHEEVPDISTIAAVKGANLVNGITFSPSDADILGEDIFHRIVPMKAHEASSMYSEEKANFLRKVAKKMEEKDVELKTFMSSLNIEAFNMVDPTTRLPQELIDRCADINSKQNAIPDLITAMSNLADICVEVETMLHEIRELLNEEDIREKNYQKTTGGRASVHFGELSREFQKYQEAHSKAGESNETLRKAMGLHVANLKILSQPLSEIQTLVPVFRENTNDDNFKKLRMLLGKVNEMQTQRGALYENLREAAIKDDITSQILAWGEKPLEELYKKEISKHNKNVALIEQNLSAQPNILTALTDTYASCAPNIKSVIDTKHKREHFFSSLIASYDVYEDLLGKSTKGLEFYKKLQTNIQKLLARIRAARDVQDEERQQRIKSSQASIPREPSIPKQQGPKLRDYMKSGALPSIRPSPLGSETNTPSTCPSTAVISNSQYYDSTAAASMANQTYIGYTNPMYQSSQYYSPHPEPPPAYTYLPPPQPTDPPPSYSPQVTPSQSATSIPHHQQQWDQSAIANLSIHNPNSYSTPAPVHHQQQETQNYYANAYGNYAANYETVQAVPVPEPTSTPPVSSAPSTSNNQYSYNMHPGYLYNQSTGEYSYGSGYQIDPINQNSRITSQYTVAGDVTQTNTTMISQQNANKNVTLGGENVASDNSNYYMAPPYGYATTPDAYSNGAQQHAVMTSVSGGNVNIPASSYADFNNAYNIPVTYISSNNNNDTRTTNSIQYGNYGLTTQNSAVDGTYNIAQQAPQYISQPTPAEIQSPTQYLYGNTPTPQYNTTASDAMHVTPSDSQISLHNIPQYYDANQAYNNTQILQQQVSQYNATYISQDVAATSQYQQPPIDTYQSNLSQQYGEIPPVQATHASPPTQHSTQNPTVAPVEPVVQLTVSKPPQPEPIKPANSNIDLLLGIDFASSELSLHPLQPEPLKPKDAGSDILVPTPAASVIDSKLPDTQLQLNVATPIEPNDRVRDFILSNPVSVDRKSSMDNLSTVSDLSSTDQNCDWESASVKNYDLNKSKCRDDNLNVILMKYKNPFDDQKVVKNFHREIERLEKVIEMLNVKNLNGSTQLDGKWKELQDLLVKDESKRTNNIAKLFPEKNRSVDCIPYDHSRVLLPTTTDDYINAAYVRELGPGCPQFILTQTPMQNTLEDYWSMIYSQKSRVVVCSHTANELLDPFWPQEINKEMSFGDYSVTLLQQFDLSHCIERNVKLTHHGSDAILNVSLLQIKSWTKNSAANIHGIAGNIITAYRQKVLEMNESSIITVNCLSGSERSGIISLAVAIILGTQNRRPILINIVDVWYRICSQRKSALRDSSQLQLAYQIVLLHGHDLLNKRGIMTSYQMKQVQTQKVLEKEEVHDPFSDLDPLWQLKAKK